MKGQYLDLLRNDPRYRDCWVRCEHERFCLECDLECGLDEYALWCAECGWGPNDGHESKECERRAFWIGLCEKHFTKRFTAGAMAREIAAVNRAAKLKKIPHERKRYIRTRSDAHLERIIRRTLGLTASEPMTDELLDEIIGSALDKK